MKNEKLSYKKTLSADAKLIIALLRKQPQTRDALCKVSKISVSTFYRNIPLLKGLGKIKETEGGFALWTYIELEKDIENVLATLDTDSITVNRIASMVGVQPSEIESLIYPLVKKYGMEVRVDKGEKIVARIVEGTVIF